MARLAAVEKLLYYPTQTNVIPLLAKHFKFFTETDHWHDAEYLRIPIFFDPCCGDGTALKQLADAISPGCNFTVGVELHQERAKTASAQLKVVLQGDIFEYALQVGNQAGTMFECDFMLLNPPYDGVTIDNETSRYELEFLQQTMAYVSPNGGVLAYVVREPFLRKYADSIAYLLENYSFNYTDILDYPSAEKQEFQQCVLIAKRYSYGTYIPFKVGSQLKPMSGFTHRSYREMYAQKYLKTDVDPLDVVQAIRLPVVDVEPLGTTNIDAFKQYMGDYTQSNQSLAPLGDLRDEHAILVAAGGLLNGVRFSDLVVKGHSYRIEKVAKSIKQDEQGRDIEQTLYYQEFVHQLTFLDLSLNRISTYNDYDNPVAWQDAMVQYGRAFLDAAKELYEPYASPERLARYLPKLLTITPGKKLPMLNKAQVLPEQADTAARLLTGWERNKVLTLGGEMSVGKTLISLMVAYTKVIRRKPHLRKIVVLVPATTSTVKKWVKEVEMTLGPLGAKVFECRTKAVTDRAFAHKGLAVLIIPETAAKLTTGWHNVRGNQIGKVRTFIWHRLGYNGTPQTAHFGKNDPARDFDPDMDRAYRDKDGHYKIRTTRTQHREQLFIRTFGYRCPMCGKATDLAAYTKKAYCQRCRKPLWQVNSDLTPIDQTNNRDRIFGPYYDRSVRVQINPNKIMAGGKPKAPTNAYQRGSKPKVALGKYIREHYHRRYVLIVDEAHEYKSGSSARGYASNDLLSASYKALQMTGTFSDGMASSIFYLLYRSSPIFREMYRYNDVQKFINVYGLTEKVVKYMPTYKGDTFSGYREYIGTPSERPGTHPGMVMLLLPTTVFLALSDLGYAMVPYSEHTLFVALNESLRKIYDPFVDEAKRYAMNALREFKDMSPLATWQHARYRVLDTPFRQEEIGDAEYRPDEDWDYDQPFNKELAFLRLVWREKGRKRPVLCFCAQMGVANPAPRLVKLMELHGLRGIVMRGDVADRTEFIQEAVAEGYDVVFTSAPLVQVSVDIIETPTIIWYGVEFQTIMYPQANRRPYRLTQTEPVEIYYLAYQSTVQAAAFTYIAKKIGASQILQGHKVSGLARLQGDDTFVRHLQDVVMASDQEFDSDLTLDSLDLLPGEYTVEPEPIVQAVEPITIDDVRIYVPRVFGKRYGKQAALESGLGYCLICMNDFTQNGDKDHARFGRMIPNGPIYRLHAECADDVFEIVDVV